jgi:hypothetical protein
MPVQVTRDVFEGLEACRKSGEYNMFEFNSVTRWCLDHQYFNSVIWMTDNKKEYEKAIFEGFEILEV